MPGASAVDIEAGSYLVFESEGHMPQLVIDAWTAVWHYFAANPRYSAALAPTSRPTAGRTRWRFTLGFKGDCYEICSCSRFIYERQHCF